MNTSLLSLVDRLTHKLDPLSAALDAVIEHLIPQQASNACSGIVCYKACVGPSKIEYFYAPSGYWCVHGGITCSASFYDPVDC